MIGVVLGRLFGDFALDALVGADWTFNLGVLSAEADPPMALGRLD